MDRAPLAVLALGSLIFLADPAHDSRGFWRPRPWDRRAVGCAKASFLLFLIAVPAGLVTLAEPIWFRISDPYSLAAQFLGGTGTALTSLWLVWMTVGLSSNGRTATGLGLLSALFVYFTIRVLGDFSPGLIFYWLFMSLPLVRPVDVHWGVLVLGFALLPLVYMHYATSQRYKAGVFGFGLYIILAILLAGISVRYENRYLRLPDESKHVDNADEPRLQLDSAWESPDQRGLTFSFHLPEDGLYRDKRESNITVASFQKVGSILERRPYNISRENIGGFYDFGFENAPVQLRPPPSYTATGKLTYHQHRSLIGQDFHATGSLELTTSSMEPCASFHLNGTQSHAGVACWVSPWQFAEEEGIEIQIRSCYSPWIAMVDVLRGRDPTPALLASAWDPETKEIIRYNDSGDFDNELASKLMQPWEVAGIRFPSMTSLSDLKVMRVEVSRIIRSQSIQEYFTDTLVKITPLPANLQLDLP
ncbi:MAG: hypothetical protein ACI8T1_003903 [Verrucomicrobiales bacterium]|jgi:hypothetical protein